MSVDKQMSDFLSKIDKEFGRGAVQRMSDKPVHNYDVIKTGSLSLDLALGIGGLPRGRVIEIYGQESSGKTTLAIHLMAEAQKKGINVAIIDSEFAFDPEYARNLGVDMEKLFISQPTTAEEGLEIADYMCNSGLFGLVVVDSVAAMVPKSELDGEMGDSKMGVMARLMSQAMRKLTGSVSKNNVLMLFINQTREKIGVMFGSPITTTGGNALKFYSSIRLEVSRSTQIKDGDEAIGNLTKVKVVKNKTAPPFKIAEFNIEYGRGISRMDEVLSFAVELDIVKKSGSWYSYGDTKIGQGVSRVKETFEDNPELYEEIEEKVLEVFNNGGITPQEEVVYE